MELQTPSATTESLSERSCDPVPSGMERGAGELGSQLRGQGVCRARRGLEGRPCCSVCLTLPSFRTRLHSCTVPGCAFALSAYVVWSLTRPEALLCGGRDCLFTHCEIGEPGSVLGTSRAPGLYRAVGAGRPDGATCRGEQGGGRESCWPGPGVLLLQGSEDGRGVGTLGWLT